MSLLGYVEGVASYTQSALSWISSSLNWLSDDTFEWLPEGRDLIIFFSGIFTLLGIQKFRRWRENAVLQNSNQHPNSQEANHSEQPNRTEGALVNHSEQLDEIKSELAQLKKVFTQNELVDNTDDPNGRVVAYQLFTWSNIASNLVSKINKAAEQMLDLLNEEDKRRARQQASSSTPTPTF